MTNPVADIGCILDIIPTRDGVILRSTPSDTSSFPVQELEVLQADYNAAQRQLQDAHMARICGANGSYILIEQFPQVTSVEHCSDGRSIVYMTDKL